MRRVSSCELTSDQDPIFVTKPYLPPLGELLPYLEGIWARRILTNNGPLALELESRLRKLFGVPGCSLMNNGTSALIAPLLALPKGSEVVTTPFTFAATTHSIAMLGLKPVFADIDPDYFGLAPQAVEAAITENTSAILAVHTYGTPCDVLGLAEVAERHEVKLFYDASHAFGVEHKGRSLLSFGDASTLSFHATKSFNTFEGGAVIAPATETEARINLVRNFGIRGEGDIPEIGFNGKMSEFNAAVGLVQLDHFENVRARRREVHEWYVEAISGLPGVTLTAQRPDTTPNYSYFPILISRDCHWDRDQIYAAMEAQGVVPRRYFAPLTSDIEPYRDLPSSDKSALPVASDIGARVLCLPIYPDLIPEKRERVVHALNQALTVGPIDGFENFRRDS